MPLFPKCNVDRDTLASITLQHWQVQLGELLRASQNQTFLAKSLSDSNLSFIVRATPDPESKKTRSVQVEFAFLEYLKEHHLPVCPAVPSKLTGERVVKVGDLLVSVFTFAVGSPVDFCKWEWMAKVQVVGVGRWLGKMHMLSKQFTKEHSDVFNNARDWTDLHDRILQGVPISQEDLNTIGNSDYFGLIHGDVHVGNYFWDDSVSMPCLYDWDQVQRCWFLYDVAQPIWSVMMLEGAGSPFASTPEQKVSVPQANSAQYTEWLIEGYEQEFTCGKVDRLALARMVDLRRQLYTRFCQKALQDKEVEWDSAMGKFCRCLLRWLDPDKLNTLTPK